MLVRLNLENFFLIKGEELYFDKGLNVITGETGTGKSLTLSSLLFLMGEEGDYAEGTCVEAELFSEGESVVLRREIVKGRSRYYLNGRGSNKRVVEEILSSQVLLQGQNDRTKITRLDFQRDVYDRFVKALEIRSRVEKAYEEVGDLRERLKNLREKRIEREIRKRLLEEEIKEIDSIGLSPESYGQVKKRLEEINLAEKINRLVLSALSGLEAGSEGLKVVSKALKELLSFKDVKDQLDSLEPIRETLFEIERSLKGMLVSYSQEELDSLNEKVFKVQRLERKYGMSYRELWDHLQKLKEELKRFEEEENPEGLEEELKRKEEELERLYHELSEIRQRGKEEFERKVLEYLKDMGLEKASFKVHFEERVGRYGREQVKFLFSSYGRDEREISDVASGGEVSRLSLALFMLSPPAQTYVLDEVDTGISGITSIRLARLLRELSKNTQLIVITHQPAVACAGSKHFTTRKEYMEDMPLIKVVELGEEERLEEIARLMGKVNENTIKGARDLIKEVCGV
jgi:DNA repair protein RecN (Recombination protein N)|uniref:DNA repair protein RecN n=1 Tax=Hydrogenobacter sp. TaxID=2152829 RepID=A0A7C2VEG8_9AQUI